MWVCQTIKIVSTISFLLHWTEVKRETRYSSCPPKFLVSQEHQLCVTHNNNTKFYSGTWCEEGIGRTSYKKFISFFLSLRIYWIPNRPGSVLSLGYPVRTGEADIDDNYTTKCAGAHYPGSLTVSMWLSEILWERSLKDRMLWKACPTEERWQESPSGGPQQAASGWGSSASEVGCAAQEILVMQRCVLMSQTFFRSSLSPDHSSLPTSGTPCQSLPLLDFLDQYPPLQDRIMARWLQLGHLSLCAFGP